MKSNYLFLAFITFIISSCAHQVKKENSFNKKQLPLAINKPSKGWKRIVIKEIGTIDLSPQLEIQSGKYKIKNKAYQDSISKIWKVNFTASKLTLQPKGINDFNKLALDKYCRVMLESVKSKPNDYQRLNEDIITSSSELSELNNLFKSQLQQSFYNTPLSLIEWYPLKINKINGMTCIHTSYKRQFEDNPYVHVDLYRFLNFDRIISLTISYRISEKTYWSSSLKKSLESFRITNIK